MPSFRQNLKTEHYEWITGSDIITAAHTLMDGIDLDPASSDMANTYVCADNYYTIKDDGLNYQKWHGSVYLFPPAGSYFWNANKEKWVKTRGLSPTLSASHSVWWKTMKRKWLDREIKQALFFSNMPDMFLYSQDMFDHPVCILKTRPTLRQHFLATDEIKERTTCCSFVVYLQPQDMDPSHTENFIEIFRNKGRILV